MSSNSTKVWIFILASSISLLMLGYQFGDRLGLLGGFLITVLLNFFVFFYGENQLLKKLKAVEVKGQDAWGLVEMTEKLADKAGVKVPSIYLIADQAETAFCVSYLWRTQVIGVSEKLVKNFSKEDLEAVLAYEISHLQKMNSFGFSMCNTLANAVIGVGEVLDHFWPPNYFLTKSKKQKPFMTLLTPVGWTLIRLATRHSSFYENDLSAADLIHDRFRVAEVLWRLEGMAQTQPMNLPPCSSHLFIVNPESDAFRNKVLQSHPSIETRLQKLMGYYPI